MKIYLQFEDFKQICNELADRIYKKYGDNIKLISITRGGNFAGTLIAKRLRKDLDFFYPKTQQLTFFSGGNDLDKKWIFIEDLIAQGRTYDIVVKFMREQYPDVTHGNYVPIVIDAKYPYQHFFDLYGMRTSDWVVFPWEEMDAVTEGDRGLFRERSDAYGK